MSKISSFGERLAENVHAIEWSDADIASGLTDLGISVTTQTVSRWRAGDRVPRWHEGEAVLYLTSHPRSARVLSAAGSKRGGRRHE